MSWAYTYDPHLWPPLATAILTVLLGWYGWQRHNFPGAKPLALVCLFASLWAVGSTLEIAAADFLTKIFWIKYQAIWHLPTLTALLCFILVFVGLGRWLTRRNLFLLIIPPLLTLLLIITNDYHHFIWTGFQMDEHVLQFFGVANWILLAYAYILGLIDIIVLLWLAIRSPNHRWPVAIMLFGLITGLGIYLASNIYTDFLRPGERILFVLGTLSSTYAFVFYRFHFLDPVPAARAVAVDQMGDGMLVLDLEWKIVDSNPAAAKMIEGLLSDLLGHPVTEVLPVNTDLLALDKGGTIQSEISLGSGKENRYYNMYLTMLKGRRGQPLGRLLMLHEVTEQKRAQAQVIEQQRVVATLQERERLARELHDGIGQVLGYAGMQAQSVRKWMRDGNTEKADSLLARLVEVVKDAHTDVRESIFSLKAGSGQEWAFVPELRRYLNDFQANYDIRTELIIPEELTEDVFTPGSEVQVLRVIQEALANARKHSGASLVRVAIKQEDGMGCITIADDGSGFDPGQINQLNGRHFGLAFMRERMEQIGGSIKIDSRLGAGTIVNLELPLREQTEET